MDHLPDEYATYNGLNRPAMVMGVPLMLLLVVGFLAVFGGFGSLMIFGIKGVIVPLSLGIFLLAVRVACENDPNALRVIRLSFSGFRLKLMHGDKIIGYDSTGL